MKHLRHRDAIIDSWAYDVASRTVLARFSNGLVLIPVCTEKQPRHGAFFLSRKDGGTWQVSPVRCTATPEGFAARACSFDHDGVHCEFLQLADSPEEISDLLADLYEVPVVEDDRPTLRTLKTPSPSRLL